jgi:hypothetical protein
MEDNENANADIVTIDNRTEKTNIIDFGFSTTSEDEIKREERDAIHNLNNDYQKAQLRVVELRNMIWPLLEQLRKDPARNIIKWPNRAQVINDLMKRIDDHVNQG